MIAQEMLQQQHIKVRGWRCAAFHSRAFFFRFFGMMEDDDAQLSINPGRLCLKPSSPSKIKDESVYEAHGWERWGGEKYIKADESERKSVLTKLDRK
jgi:hypothetical protein